MGRRERCWKASSPPETFWDVRIGEEDVLPRRVAPENYNVLDASAGGRTHEFVKATVKGREPTHDSVDTLRAK